MTKDFATAPAVESVTLLGTVPHVHVFLPASEVEVFLFLVLRLLLHPLLDILCRIETTVT